MPDLDSTVKVLHIAPTNVAGVPLAFVRAERALGLTSRLLTLAPTRLAFPDDLCARVPFLDSPWLRAAKRLFADPARLRVTHAPPPPAVLPPTWRPHSVGERGLVALRDRLWAIWLRPLVKAHQLFDFDVYQLDGGLGFLRSGAWIQALKRRGKQVVVCYLGSDLRTRGRIPAVDDLADVRVTVEFDHLQLDPALAYVPVPCDADGMPPTAPPVPPPIRIGHAPSVRQAKGTDIIIEAVRALAATQPVELVLIETLPHAEALRRKAACHLFIDQVGTLGFGVNALEAVAMGLPTCTGLAEGYAAAVPDHPFIPVTAATLGDRLRGLVTDWERSAAAGRRGPAWVRRRHDPRVAVRRIHALRTAATQAARPSATPLRAPAPPHPDAC